MNLFLTYTITILLVVFSFKVNGQPSNSFKDLLHEKNLGKTFTTKIGKDILQRTYLGKIQIRSKGTSYFAVKEFYRVKAAIVYHGHSRLIFCDSNKKYIAQYRLNMPDQLPYKLKRNIFYFSYKDNGILTKSEFEIYGELPEFMCLRPANFCFQIENK